MPVSMRRVLSSHVLDIGYDAETQELHVRFAPTVKKPAGAYGSYAGVAPETAENVMSSPSIGSAIFSDIKPYFTWNPLN